MFKLLPETNGKSLVEVESLFAKKGPDAVPQFDRAPLLDPVTV